MAAYGVEPQAGIAIDVTHATDCPGVEQKAHGEIKMGAGPTLSYGANINPALNALLARAAKAGRVPVQREAAPRATGTDANTMQVLARRRGHRDHRAALPVYAHPGGGGSRADLSHAAKLLAEALVMLSPETSFIPA